MSEITREELLAFTEAHAKVCVALEKISERLGDIVDNQEKVLVNLTSDNLVNKVAQATATATQARIESSAKEINETLTVKLPGTLMEKINNSDIAKDIDFVKVLITVFGIVIVVVVIVVKLMFTPQPLTQEEVKQIVGSELGSLKYSLPVHNLEGLNQ